MSFLMQSSEKLKKAIESFVTRLGVYQNLTQKLLNYNRT